MFKVFDVCKVPTFNFAASVIKLLKDAGEDVQNGVHTSKHVKLKFL